MNIILEDFLQHRKDLLAWGFWALLIFRLGDARRRFKSPFIRKPWGALHKVAAAFSELFFGIAIGINARIGRRFTIEHSGCIVIHNNVIIGDDVIVRQGVTLGNRTLKDHLHAPTIGRFVNIGAGAKVLGAVVIGDNVDIGANAVVITDIPANSIAVGVPAVVKTRKGI